MINYFANRPHKPDLFLLNKLFGCKRTKTNVRLIFNLVFFLSFAVAHVIRAELSRNVISITLIFSNRQSNINWNIHWAEAHSRICHQQKKLFLSKLWGMKFHRHHKNIGLFKRIKILRFASHLSSSNSLFSFVCLLFFFVFYLSCIWIFSLSRILFKVSFFFLLFSFKPSLR